MILCIPQILNLRQLEQFRAQLEGAGAPWVDGRATAGYQGASVKHNRQLDETSALARQLGGAVLAELERNALFISAALPQRVYPPLFNSYEAGMSFGSHVDGAIRRLPGLGQALRTDLSATLFLVAPEEYEGGELVLEGPGGVQRFKLPAGDMVLYPTSALHHVTAVTRGRRLACFFWIQSLVRQVVQREQLFDLDSAIQRLNATGADPDSMVRLVGVYHNLLRAWSEP
jgi:PKHD-type hydroxylase